MEDVDGIRRLYIDGYQAAEYSRWDSPSHRVIAHLPLLLHKHPKRALVVGFGMGITTYSITQHKVEVDAIEISRGVIKANKYFTHVNGNVLKNPLAHLYEEDDGRNFILTTRNKYDVISTGITHPLVSSGSSSIYKRIKDRHTCASGISENILNPLPFKCLNYNLSTIHAFFHICFSKKRSVFNKI